MRARDVLPGINVEVAPEQARTTLPRMDVAVFAGFAARGPCHVPIAVSSAAQFEATFGGDCGLAFDRVSGKRIKSNLSPAVLSFFANGGRRCWIIRIASTRELSAAAASVGATIAAPPASPGIFPMTGLVARLPAAGGGSQFEPTRLMASSLGSWSDSLRLAARIARDPIGVADLTGVTGGLSFLDRGKIVRGDLIELKGKDGLTTAYVKAVRVADGRVFAVWAGALKRINEAVAAPVQLSLEGGGTLTAVFKSNSGDGIVEVDTVAAGVRTNGWLSFAKGAAVCWMRVDRFESQTVFGPVWQEDVLQLPAGPVSAARVTIDVREYFGSTARTHSGLGLTPESRAAIQGFADCDRFYAAAANRSGAIRAGFAITREEADRIELGYAGAGDPGGFDSIARRLGTPALTSSDRIALQSAWLPIGLDERFTDPVTPMVGADDPLVRDGLAVIDDSLFLDPRLAQGDCRTLAERAEAILHVQELPLFGIHSALAAAGDLFPEPSLLVVPDAAQPDWAEAARETAPDPVPGAAVQPSWVNHSGGCPPVAAPPPLAGPDQSRFLDCSTKLLPAPQLNAPKADVPPDAPFILSWSAAPPGSVFVLEESARPDFTPSAEILRGESASITVAGKREGLYYYRLRAEHDGNVSAWAAAVVAVRGSRFVVTDVNRERTRRLHVAMLRLAGGTGELFALLAMPRQFRSADAIEHAQLLRTLAPGAGGSASLGQDEERVLSFGALCHPWVVTGSEEGPVSISPDGAVAGLIARRTTESGAWIAPANEPIESVFGLDTAYSAAERLGLDLGRVNMIRKLGSEFALEDSLTLSDEPDWGEINVRRLMILLRRFLLQRGMTYLFEPNGPVLRRAVERDLGTALDYLQVRGAFAGRSSAQSFRIAVAEEAGDLDAGRLIVELGVAPARPMAFLTVRLVRRGDGVTVEEV